MRSSMDIETGYCELQDGGNGCSFWVGFIVVLLIIGIFIRLVT